MNMRDIDQVPGELASIGVRNGDEMAWKPGDCATAIEWLRSTGRAVLGTELWRLNGGHIYTSIKTSGGPAIYCTASDPLQYERWEDYLDRSAALAIDWIASFRWPDDATEPPDPVYFNITWADRSWFREHSRAKISDD
jgi:hypothetical protein